MSGFIRRIMVCGFVFGVLVHVADADAALRWGDQGSKCNGTQRVDYARLWGLAPLTDWVGICRRTKAAGVSARADGKVPSTCVQHVDSSVWGEWKFSNHPSCQVQPPPAPSLSWSNVGDKCENGVRVEYARLWGLQPGTDWVGICSRTKASGVSALSDGKVPSVCVNRAPDGVWGEWKYSNHSSCAARWGDFKKDQCVRSGYRQWSSRLWEAGADPLRTCKKTAATVNGQRFVAPTRCKNLGVGGVWGEFHVRDDSCPFWGNELGTAGVVRGECAALNVRKYYARLWDIAGREDWNAACHAKAATVAGATTTPARCVNKGPLGMWGEWLVADNRCTADKLPQDARREAIARAKLEEMRDTILSNLDVAALISRDQGVARELQAGDPVRIASSVRKAEGEGEGEGEGGSAQPTGSFPRTLTVGAVVSTKILVIGGSAEAGAAIDWAGRRPVYAYGAAGYDWGPGMAASGGVNVGFWVCQNNKIGGDVWGWTFGLDDLGAALLKKNPFGKGPGIALGLWFSYPDKNDPNSHDEFQGFTLTPGYGVGADFVGLNYATTAVDGDETVNCDGSPKQ